MQRNEYYASLSLDELVEEINNVPEWDNEQLQELCYRADLEDKWEQTTDENYENLIKEAADKLDVKIIGANQFDILEKATTTILKKYTQKDFEHNHSHEEELDM